MQFKCPYFVPLWAMSLPHAFPSQVKLSFSESSEPIAPFLKEKTFVVFLLFLLEISVVVVTCTQSRNFKQISASPSNTLILCSIPSFTGIWTIYGSPTIATIQVGGAKYWRMFSIIVLWHLPCTLNSSVDHTLRASAHVIGHCSPSCRDVFGV